jgi:hypothetical protein
MKQMRLMNVADHSIERSPTTSQRDGMRYRQLRRTGVEDSDATFGNEQRNGQ